MFLASYPGAEQYIMLMTYILEINKKVRWKLKNRAQKDTPGKASLPEEERMKRDLGQG